MAVCGECFFSICQCRWYTYIVANCKLPMPFHLVCKTAENATTASPKSTIPMDMSHFNVCPSGEIQAYFLPHFLHFPGLRSTTLKFSETSLLFSFLPIFLFLFFFCSSQSQPAFDMCDLKKA